jgi:hypothetical protein
MTSGANNVVDGYEPPRARASDCGEVYPQLLRFTPGGVRSPRFRGSASPSSLPSLLCCLPHRLLALLGRLARRVLHALRHLPNLIGDPAQSTSEAAALLLAAAGEPAYGVLDALDGLSGLIGDLTCGVLSLLGGSSHGILGLASHLSYLICGLSRCLLGLPDCLTCGVLHLLGRSLCGLHDLLLGILGGLIHRVFDVHVLSRPIDHILELRVGVGHLLDLGLRVSLGHLLSILLQLGAIILRLALDPAYRPPVEFLGVLDGLLLKILSLIGHFISNPSSIVASCEQWG